MISRQRLVGTARCAVRLLSREKVVPRRTPQRGVPTTKRT